MALLRRLLNENLPMQPGVVVRRPAKPDSSEARLVSPAEFRGLALECTVEAGTDSSFELSFLSGETQAPLERFRPDLPLA